jgi:CheY-like chemotaxis protein
MVRILIVDDNPLDLRVASKLAEAEGMQTLAARDGREALGFLADDHPDLVLTDLDMPHINGLELVREVRRSHPAVPIVLMTARGSEETAVEALKSGAASYVPKRNLKKDLGSTLRMVLAAATARNERRQVFGRMEFTETRFVFGYEPRGPAALVSYCQDALRMMDLCDEAEMVRVGTALTEALQNAVDHGNLELDSRLREEGDGTEYHDLGRRRMDEPPYKDRRVRVTMRLSPTEAAFVVRDDGPGFDPASRPDPTAPENLALSYGRGLMLIHTFMDEVSFNGRGNEITMVQRKQDG